MRKMLLGMAVVASLGAAARAFALEVHYVYSCGNTEEERLFYCVLDRAGSVIKG